jgi:putative protease
MKEKIIISPPVFTFSEEVVTEKLRSLHKLGFARLLATNISHFALQEFTLHTSHFLNITNSLAVKTYAELKAVDITASVEIKAGAVRALQSDLPVGIVGYGHLPLMVTANCPLNFNCAHCQKPHITDRKNKRIEIICKKDYMILLNSTPLCTADRLGTEFPNISLVTLMFTNETEAEIDEIFSSFLQSKKPEKEFTRGLYF